MEGEEPAKVALTQLLSAIYGETINPWELQRQILPTVSLNPSIMNGVGRLSEHSIVAKESKQRLEMVIHDIEVSPHQEGYYPVNLKTSRGIVECRYYPVTGAQRGAIWVGGAGGGWDTPAQGLYPQLCQELMGEAIASLQVRYRYPNNLEESVLDVHSRA